jgi:hypothetical protein
MTNKISRECWQSIVMAFLPAVFHHDIAAVAGLSVARQLGTQREQRISAILNSKSWRFTAPFRWLRRKLPLRR